MTSYQYRAARQDGALVAGALEAESSGQATAVLVERGLFPIAVQPDAKRTEHRPAAHRRDLAVAFRGIAALVAGGVPLERAVGASEALAPDELRRTLAHTREALRAGQSLAQALADSRGVVPGVVVGMVRAGEWGSRLSDALDQVAAHLEQEADLAARLRQALAYPLLLAVAGTASVLVIGTVIVPRFAELLADLGGELPLATRILLGGSDLVARYWWLVLGGVVSGGWFVARAWQRQEIRTRIEDAMLTLPLIGPLRLALATTRFTRALGAMLGAGMPLLPALDAAREAAGNSAVAERARRARERVAAGQALAPSLDREHAVASMALQLVAVGESSGRLAEMTRRAGDLAAQEAERALKTLVTLVEPALIVAFGGLVAFVAAALLQAVYSVRPM